MFYRRSLAVVFERHVAELTRPINASAPLPGSCPFAERRYPGLEVLEERYARGEISREDYLQNRLIRLFHRRQHVFVEAGKYGGQEVD